jgi:crossover junction endodeoxyribonuclease RuvC
MIILGIDPGVARVGYGVLEYQGDRITAACHGCIETMKADSQGERLCQVKEHIGMLVAKYRPATIAIEKLFFEKNAKTAIMVGEGRGVILLAAAEAGLPVVEMTPLQVKQTVAGSGRADKRQVQEMVKRLLKLNEIPKPDDAADALAIAITGMRLAEMERRLSLSR